MSDPSFGNVFYELGEPVPPGTFPPLAFGRSGTGRLAVGTVTTSSGVALRADPWFVDTDRGISCTAEAFADGAVRCVPGSTPGILRGGASEVFADDACTRPITRVYASPCASYAPREAVVYTADACGVTTASSVHLLGAPFAGDAVYWWKDGACAVSPYPVTGHFEIGAEVDPSVFASIDEGIELPGRRRPGARSHGRHPSPRAGRLPGAARRQLHATALHPLGRRGERAGSAGVALNPRWKRRCRVDAPPGTPAA